MPSTFDPLLRLELQTPGENEFTWGIKANATFEQIAQSIAGLQTLNIAGSGDFTLTVGNGATDQSRFAATRLQGLLTGNRDIVIPAVSKLFLFRNDTTGNFRVRVKTASGSAIILDRGVWIFVVCDGADCHYLFQQEQSAPLVSTSSTSATIGAGTQTLFISPGKSFIAEQYVVAYSAASPNSYMAGQVTSYNSTTGELVFSAIADMVGGSGTFTDWRVVGLKGPALLGWRFHTGSGAPASTLGRNSDLYLDTSNDLLFRKSAGTWAIADKIGLKFYFGGVAPPGATGVDEDLYLNTSSAELFQKSGGTWQFVDRLGVEFLNGSGPPAPSLGTNTDYYLDTLNGDLYQKIAGVWTIIVNLVGPTGAGSTIFVRNNGVLTGPARGTLNFIAPGVIISDDVPNARVNIEFNLTGAFLSFYTRGIY